MLFPVLILCPAFSMNSRSLPAGCWTSPSAPRHGWCIPAQRTPPRRAATAGRPAIPYEHAPMLWRQLPGLKSCSGHSSTPLRGALSRVRSPATPALFQAAAGASGMPRTAGCGMRRSATIRPSLLPHPDCLQPGSDAVLPEADPLQPLQDNLWHESCTGGEFET